MAEAVLFDVAAGILMKLGSRGVHEIGLWWNLKDDLNKLKNTVTTIQAVLLDADQKYYSEPSNQFRVWVDKLREAFFDADDLLDDFSTMALRRQVQDGNKFEEEVRRFFSSANPFVYGLKMAHKIKAIRDRFDEIAAERTKFHLVEKHVEALTASARGRDQTHSSLPEVVVGRDEDKKNILKLLFCESYEENVVVIPIVGMGGLGKTTLAQLVCNDEEVGKHFGLSLWVCVSDNFDVKLIAEKIIESITGKKSKDLEMNTVKNILLENIKNRKYLLVLDDVWNENKEKWSRLRALLLGGAKGNRIIITSRFRRVAEITSDIPPYELQGLSETHSWLLFEQMAFKRREGPTSSNKENIGKEILWKWKGVPLAIKTIGRLLFFKQAESEWLRFKNEELSKVDQNEDDILPTLKLSYDLLPSHLKQCFAYCRLFPKDYEFEVKQVIDLWKAQGYIANPSSLDKSVEEIGEEYYKDLLWRSFLEGSRREDLLKMHDLMHDLATRMAGSTSTTLSMSNSINIDEKVRHVSVYFDNNMPLYWEALSSLFKASKLRTILFQGYERPKITKEQFHAIFSKCRYLRVLDLNNFGMKIVPRSIAKLKHLRYLDLSNNWELEMLPDSVCKLQNLEVLILDWCVKLGILPRDINKLVNLRRLCLFSCHSLRYMPRGIGELSGLEDPSRFVVGREKDEGGVGELRGLNCLRGTLQITNLPHVKREFKEANLKAKQHIKELELSWEYYDSSPNNVAEIDEEALEDLQPHQNLKKLGIDCCYGLKFPRWISSLTNLKSIKVRECHGFAHLTPLHDLTSLIELEITDLHNLEYIHSDAVNENSGFLQSLKTLVLFGCPNLKGWWPPTSTTEESLPHFQCLSSLRISNCPHLTSMPQFPPLKTMELTDVSRDLVVDIFKIEVEDNSSTHPCQEAKSVVRVPQESLKKLSSLEQLVMCENLGKEIIIQASHGKHLTSLERLCVRDCEDLNMSGAEEGQDEDMFWERLPSLNSLCICNIPKLCCLPDGIQRLPNLRYLSILDCPNLKSLPEWKANTSLSCLEIERCGELRERCRDKDSEDWHLIAHIPTIYIDYQCVQENGVYKL